MDIFTVLFSIIRIFVRRINKLTAIYIDRSNVKIKLNFHALTEKPNFILINLVCVNYLKDRAYVLPSLSLGLTKNAPSWGIRFNNSSAWVLDAKGWYHSLPSCVFGWGTGSFSNTKNSYFDDTTFPKQIIKKKNLFIF